MGFRIKIFKKQFVFLLFSACSISFITLVENMIAASKSFNINLRFILLIQCLITRITSAKMSGNFIQFILSSSATSEFSFFENTVCSTSLNILDR